MKTAVSGRFRPGVSFGWLRPSSFGNDSLPWRSVLLFAGLLMLALSAYGGDPVAGLQPSFLVNSSSSVAVAVQSAGKASQAQEQDTGPFDQASYAEFQGALEILAGGKVSDGVQKLETLKGKLEDKPEAATALGVVEGVLGGLYLELGDPQRAFGLLESLAEDPGADPAVLYNAGRAAKILGRPNIAGQYLMRSVRLEPSSPATRELGLLMAESGRPEEGYRFLLPWAQANPDDLDVRLAATLGAVQLKRVNEAEMLLADLPQDDARTQFLWARVLLLKGDPYGALGYLEPLAEDSQQAQSSDLNRLLGRAYLLTGEADKAVTVLKRLDESARRDPLVAMQLADAYFQNGQLDLAKETLSPFAAPLVDAEPPENPEPLAKEMVLEYGRVLQGLGEAEASLPFLRLATELSPDRKEGWQALGQALAATGDRDAAKTALERFQELNRASEDDSDTANQMIRDLDDPTAKGMREAMQQATQGDVSGALQRLATEGANAPGDPRPALLASRLLLQTGQNEQALGAAQTGLQMAPDLADSHYQLGAVLMAMEQQAESEKAFLRALELSPDHPAALSDFAVLLIAQDRNSEARVLLERLLAVRPGDPQATRSLETLDKQ